MAVVGGIVSVIGLAINIDEGKSQAREAKRQKIAKRASEFTVAQRERRAALREKRVRQAQLSTASAATGVTGSSGELATEAALSTNFATNVGFLNQRQATVDVIGASQVRQARSRVKQGIGQAIQSTGVNIFSANGGFKDLFD